MRPTLEYCSSVWDPYYQKDIDKLDNIQRQAARFVLNNYSKTPGTVTNILSNLNWTSLQLRRKYSRLVLYHKMVYNHVDVDLKQYLTPYARQSRHHHHLAFQIPSTTADYYKYSFFPEHVVSAELVFGFISALAASMFQP